MGTRADFYIGKGKEAQWIGSIAWDGYRDGIEKNVLNAKTEDEFTKSVNAFFGDRDDVTTPDMGWPWPWDDSFTSDCSYWFFDSQVWDDVDGRYVQSSEELPDDWEESGFMDDKERIDYPHMKVEGNSALAGSNRSGIVVVIV